MRATLGACVLTAAGSLWLVCGLPPLAAQETPKRYALVIGLNDFRSLNGKLKPLRFANRDAQSIARVLESNGFQVTPLINGGAKRNDIVAELNKHAQIVKRDDTFILFFAGHGVRNSAVGESTYWLTYDARLDAPDVEGIRLDHLMDYVRDIRAERKLVLLDHCYSGRVGARPGAAPSLDATQPGARAGSDDTLIVERGTEPVPGWATVRPRSAGFMVLGASRELAYESEEEGHGLFTAALVAALTSREADTDNNTSLSAIELLAFLPNRIKALAKKYGKTQVMDDMVEGNALGDWELIGSLPQAAATVGDAQARRERYRAVLTDWTLRGFITAAQKLRCARLVDKWLASVVSGTVMEPFERALFEVVKGFIEDSSPEEERARNLAEDFTRICAANPQSDICR